MGEIYVSKVAELREARGLTQRQLADLVGVDPSTIRNWERDRGGVQSFVKLAKLCEALDCVPPDLFEEVEVGEDD
ncbi:helix-turn-helix domain-containing protein [Synechococcus sp. PCC 7336]|uniref:helix-turn-helix domain-containing protein n=1 Tax=Synechococcus sp. PCC 7336 TaxID=195250 RepID=UPI000345636A|nr:helix-turn-helix transcriptional regulator [Synechococcus sp. PCC 7336]